ncbi:hypothetical protein DMENIID0001_069440 [Sergentomyia squamirostris]
MSKFNILFIFLGLSVLLEESEANLKKDYMFIQHISLSEERELHRLCNDGDTLVSVMAASLPLNDSEYLCRTARFIGHYWIKLEDFHELVTHHDNSDDLSSHHVTLSDEEFIGRQGNIFCTLNLTINGSNCQPLNPIMENTTTPDALTDILLKFKHPTLSENYQSLRTYIVILIVVFMCITFTAVIYVTQRSVADWKEKLNHQYIFVVDNK